MSEIKMAKYACDYCGGFEAPTPFAGAEKIYRFRMQTDGEVRGICCLCWDRAVILGAGFTIEILDMIFKKK